MDLPAVARTAAEQAATWIRSVSVPGPADEWDVKGHHDFVTEVDRTAEAMITETLLGAEPGSQVIGEELRPELVTSGLVWIVDPLDGTTNFLHGYPQYAVSIAAAVDGELVAAAVSHVPLGTTVHAGRGTGAWFGNQRMSVSHTSAPSHALIGTGFPFKHLDHLGEYQRQFATVMRSTSGVRRAGSAALDLADVAAGRFDAFWELMLAPWDTAAGILLVREAGGVVTDLEGRDAGIAHSGIVAGNPAMHAWLLGVVQGDI
ncbi:MAG TPA: inositol monophosphatase family protein [Gemmatimonadales bacterium]|nr:inositol monophosphatase family protein [Gemmatimonadales bacterium]